MIVLGEHRFWRGVERRGPSECWEWRRKRNLKGYGQVRVGDRLYQAHRFAFFLAHGRHPNALVLHSCDNPPCCNPEHLREGSNDDNMKEMVAKNRQSVGEERPQAKLTEAAVRDIRQRYATGMFTQDLLGRMFSVHASIISLVVNRKIWRHVS